MVEAKKVLAVWAVVFLILASSECLGLPVLQVDIIVHKNDTATLLDARVVNNTLYPYSQPGDYGIVVLDDGGNVLYETNMSIAFYIFDVGPTNTTLVNERIPFDPGMRVLRFVHGNKTLLEVPLELCNSNGACDGMESYYSCPGDCPAWSGDGVCTPLVDGECDPDCGPGVDKDCVPTPPRGEGREENKTPARANNTVEESAPGVEMPPTVVCGNGECETGEESWCPEDCERGFPGWAWIALVLVAVLVVVALSVKREDQA